MAVHFTALRAVGLAAMAADGSASTIPIDEVASAALAEPQLCASLLLNRSVCHSKLRAHRDALADAVAAARVRPTWARAHYRLVLALCAAHTDVGGCIQAATEPEGAPTASMSLSLLRQAYSAAVMAHHLEPCAKFLAKKVSVAGLLAERGEKCQRDKSVVRAVLGRLDGGGPLCWVSSCLQLSCKSTLAEALSGHPSLASLAPATVVARSVGEVEACVSRWCRSAAAAATSVGAGWYIKHPLEGGGRGCFLATEPTEVVAAASRVLADDASNPADSVVIQRALPLQEQAQLPRGPSRLELR